MKYQRKSFSVSPGAANISQENWERTFGKKLLTTHLEPVVDPTGRSTGMEIGTVRITDTALDPGQPVRTPIPVSGVWFRTREMERDRMRWTVIEVLVEVGLKWRLIQTHEIPHIEQTISHITETRGIEKAPEDKL